MAARKKTAQAAGETPIEALLHKDTRKNIPTREQGEYVGDEEEAPPEMLYPRDPTLDPQLVWKGKDEQDRKDLAVPVVPIYIQETIHPKALVEDLRGRARGQKPQLDLFADVTVQRDIEEQIEFYEHDDRWRNRMILGDSLVVMTSLAQKEGLKGKVQMIYMDPPYGIKFGSNWQVSTRKRKSRTARQKTLSGSPSRSRLFATPGNLGFTPTYLSARSACCRARATDRKREQSSFRLATRTSTSFGALLDEVFGAENFVLTIIASKTTDAGSRSRHLVPSVVRLSSLVRAEHRTGVKYPPALSRCGIG